MDVGAASKQLTKYERTYVIGVRAEQLARGAQAFVENPRPVVGRSSVPTFYETAERELDAGVMPFVVCRRRPDGSQTTLRLADAPPPPEEEAAEAGGGGQRRAGASSSVVN